MEEEKPYYVEVCEVKHYGEVVFAKSRKEAEDKVWNNQSNDEFWAEDRKDQFESDLEIVEPGSTYLDLDDVKDGTISKHDLKHYYMHNFCNGDTADRLEDYLQKED